MAESRPLTLASAESDIIGETFRLKIPCRDVERMKLTAGLFGVAATLIG
jgi:hypothetical protein